MKKKIILTLIIFSSFYINAVELTISLPGIYTLGQSILSTPTGADSIININVSDVIFDLGGYVVAQNNATANVDGIVINSGLNDVVIQNGIIRNVTSEGILVNQACSRISVKNIYFENCASRGIAFTGAAGVNQIRDSEIKNCRFFSCANGASADSVLLLTNTIYSQVSDCIIANTAGTATLSLLNLASCTGCDFKGLTLQNNSGTTLDMVTLTSCATNVFTNLIARSNSATGLLTGLDFSSSDSNVFNNCDLIFNRSTANQFIGFNVVSTSDSNVFNQCRVSSCIGGTNCVGFNFNASVQQTLIDCLVTDNSATAAAARCIGYLFTNANFCTMLRCLASYNSSTASLGIGLVLEGTGNTNNAFINCLFNRNVGSSAANSRGVTLTVGANNLFTRNIAFNNNTTAANQLLGVAAGSVTTPGAPATSNLAAVTAAWTNMAIGS